MVPHQLDIQSPSQIRERRPTKEKSALGRFMSLIFQVRARMGGWKEEVGSKQGYKVVPNEGTEVEGGDCVRLSGFHKFEDYVGN